MKKNYANLKKYELPLYLSPIGHDNIMGVSTFQGHLFSLQFGK